MANVAISGLVSLPSLNGSTLFEVANPNVSSNSVTANQIAQFSANLEYQFLPFTGILDPSNNIILIQNTITGIVNTANIHQLTAEILIAENFPSGQNVVSFTVSGFTSFRSLKISGMGRSNVAASSDLLGLMFNNDIGNNYQTERAYGVGGASASAAQSGNTNYIYIADICGNSTPINMANSFEIEISDFSNSVFNKQILGRYNLQNTTGTGGYFIFMVGGFWQNSFPVTVITLSLSGGFWMPGSRISLYGKR